MQMITAGDLDFAIVDLFLNQKTYVSTLDNYLVEATIDEEIILVCSKSYYQQHIKGGLSIENLLAQDYISYDNKFLAINGWFKHHFVRQSVKINAVLIVDSIQAVLAAIENDIGLGVISSNQMHSGNLITITTDKKEIVNTISLIQLKDIVPSFTEKTFRHFLKTALQK